MKNRYEKKPWIPPYHRKSQIEKKPFISSSLDRLATFRKLMAEIAFIFFIIFVFITICLEVSKTGFILEPIAITSKNLKENYSEKILTLRILDEARKLESKIISLSKNRSFKNEGRMNFIPFASNNSKITVPVINLSLNSIIRYFNDALKLSKVYIGGYVANTGGEFVVSLRNISERDIPSVQIYGKDLEQLIKDKGGNALLKITYPHILALESYYKFDTEGKVELGLNDNLYKEMLKNIEYCLDYPPTSDDFKAYRLWGIGLVRLKLYDEAIKKFRKAIIINPESAQVYNNLGAAFNELDRHEEAIKEFRKSVNEDSEFSVAYNNWGVALEKLERYDEAIEVFKKSTTIMMPIIIGGNYF